MEVRACIYRLWNMNIEIIKRGIEMGLILGAIGVLIMIIIGMLFGRMMQIAGLILEAIVKLFRKLF